MRPGRSYAVLGANGAGKTTLLGLVRGDVWPDQDGIGVRVYRQNGVERTSPIGLRDKIGCVSWELQEKRLRLDLDVTGLEAVLTGFFDALRLHQPPGPARIETAKKLLAALDIAHLAETPLRALSQGQLRSVLIARALAPDPALLILDEPFEGLDARSGEIVSAAVDQAAASGAGLLFATHHPEEIPAAVERAVLLEGGRIVLEGTTGDVLEHVRASAATPHDRPPSPIAPSAPIRGTSGRGTSGRGISGRGISGRGTPNRGTPAPVVVVRDADVFLERRKILHNISWRIMPGENWALFGENGSGKTTLCRLLLGEYAPALGGEALRPGVGARRKETDLRVIRRKIGHVSGDLQARHPYDVTGRELVLSGFFAEVGLYTRPTPEQEAAADAWLAFFERQDLAARRIRSLSTGQLRLLLLARAMVNAPDLLLLDEPFAGLDAVSRGEALAAVRALANGPAALVLACHRDEDVIPEITHALRLHRGKVVYSGPFGAEGPGVAAPPAQG